MERVDGLTILKMCKAKNFKEGDILIAFQEDGSNNECTSIYRFKQGDFTDLETRDCIDLFDLVECSFLVIKPKRASEEDVDAKMSKWAEKLRREYGIDSWNAGDPMDIRYY